MLRWMMAKKKIEKNRIEEIRARAGVANITEKIREATVRWLGHVERKTDEDIVMRTWKMEASGPKLKRRYYTKRHEEIGDRYK